MKTYNHPVFEGKATGWHKWTARRSIFALDADLRVHGFTGLGIFFAKNRNKQLFSATFAINLSVVSNPVDSIAETRFWRSLVSLWYWLETLKRQRGVFIKMVRLRPNKPLRCTQKNTLTEQPIYSHFLSGNKYTILWLPGEGEGYGNRKWPTDFTPPSPKILLSNRWMDKILPSGWMDGARGSLIVRKWYGRVYCTIVSFGATQNQKKTISQRILPCRSHQQEDAVRITVQLGHRCPQERKCQTL